MSYSPSGTSSQGRGKVVGRAADLGRYQGKKASARRPARSSRRRTNRRLALTSAGGEHPQLAGPSHVGSRRGWARAPVRIAAGQAYNSDFASALHQLPPRSLPHDRTTARRSPAIHVRQAFSCRATSSPRPRRALPSSDSTRGEPLVFGFALEWRSVPKHPAWSCPLRQRSGPKWLRLAGHVQQQWPASLEQPPLLVQTMHPIEGSVERPSARGLPVHYSMEAVRCS
jgi:hypothetical protein